MARCARARTASGQSRKAILSEIDNSLRRLKTDYVDLYQIHRFDYDTPIEETLEALHDVVKAGKARYIGASSMWAWQFMKMLATQEAAWLDALRLDAEPAQPDLSRGRARDAAALRRSGHRRHPVVAAGARPAGAALGRGDQALRDRSVRQADVRRRTPTDDEAINGAVAAVAKAQGQDHGAGRAGLGAAEAAGDRARSSASPSCRSSPTRSGARGHSQPDEVAALEAPYRPATSGFTEARLGRGRERTSPHPDPLPSGKEKRPAARQQRTLSPWGEGRGEGSLPAAYSALSADTELSSVYFSAPIVLSSCSCVSRKSIWPSSSASSSSNRFLVT